VPNRNVIQAPKQQEAKAQRILVGSQLQVSTYLPLRIETLCLDTNCQYILIATDTRLASMQCGMRSWRFGCGLVRRMLLFSIVFGGTCSANSQ
jgi:hypothetical protein